jgi:hypothetical protein
MSKTRAVRLSKDEEAKLQLFLKKNPVFDFSKLARIAILRFIENPELKIQGIGSRAKSPRREEAHGSHPIA